MNIFANWQLYAVGAAYMVFMAAVGALEPPTDQDSRFYRWAFHFLNALSVNVAALKATKLPNQ